MVLPGHAERWFPRPDGLQRTEHACPHAYSTAARRPPDFLPGRAAAAVPAPRSGACGPAAPTPSPGAPQT